MTLPSAYPAPWGVEVVRNPANRAWYFVSRFVDRRTVEYLLDVRGEPIAFRQLRAALAAIKEAKAAM